MTITGHAVLLGDTRDAKRGFAAQGLGVEAALAGDDQVSVAYDGVQANQFGDDFHAGSKLRTEKGLGGEAQAAGGAAARVRRARPWARPWRSDRRSGSGPRPVVGRVRDWHLSAGQKWLRHRGGHTGDC